MEKVEWVRGNHESFALWESGRSGGWGFVALRGVMVCGGGWGVGGSIWWIYYKRGWEFLVCAGMLGEGMGLWMGGVDWVWGCGLGRFGSVKNFT